MTISEWEREGIKPIVQGDSTVVSGYISANTTWTPADSPYIVVGDVIVEPDVFLTVEPGVVIRFDMGTGLVIDGSLSAQGNFTHKIVFTSDSATPAQGDWEGIKYRGSNFIFEWCIVEFATRGVSAEFFPSRGGGDISNSHISKCQIGVYMLRRIYNVTIEDCDWGIYYCPIVEQCTICNNGVGIYAGVWGGDPIGLEVANSVVSNNSGNGISVNIAGGYYALNVHNNNITSNNGDGIYVDAITGAEVHYNNIVENQGYAFQTGFGASNAENATYNWWGTTNETLTDEQIFDYYDDYNLGKVLYKPYLTAPYSGDTIPPGISILSPQNTTYNVTPVSLTFTVNESTSWVGYSLDNQSNVTISGNTTLVGISVGQHSIIVHANDTSGNMGSSEVVRFTIAQPRTIIVPDDYPTIQGAINAANDGDTVFVRNGTYYENVVVNKTLTLIGEQIDSTIIDGSNKGDVIQVEANNVSVYDFTLQDTSAGWCGAVVESGFSDVTIANNRMVDNHCGAAVRAGTLNVTISNNSIFNRQPSYADGVRLFSSGTLVTGNTVMNESTGIGLDWTYNNTIQNCTVTNSYIGIGAGNLPIYDNVFLENTIANNSYGFLMAIYNSRFFHNNIINNGIQAAFYGPYSNTWDNGYPSGGNYWSDYSGIDSNGDGIGDTPYVIDANSTDNYPLMNPWSPPDIAVTNLTSAKTVIGQGYTGSVNVTFENLRNKIEAFNTTVYANSTSIHSEQTMLAMTNCTLSFVMNATGFAYGNYTINTYAWPLPDETNMTNNNYTCPIPVHIGVPGDVSSSTPGVYDGIVNMKDIAYLVALFQTKPTKPNWNPNADVNNDGVVDMKEIAIAIAYFNQHE